MVHVQHAFSLKKETLKMQWTTNNLPEADLVSAINNDLYTFELSIDLLVKLFSVINSSLIVRPDEGDNKLKAAVKIPLDLSSTFAGNGDKMLNTNNILRLIKRRSSIRQAS
jgi:hypothetical protein